MTEGDWTGDVKDLRSYSGIAVWVKGSTEDTWYPVYASSMKHDKDCLSSGQSELEGIATRDQWCKLCGCSARTVVLYIHMVQQQWVLYNEKERVAVHSTWTQRSTSCKPGVSRGSSVALSQFCDGSRAPRVAGARDSGSPDMCTGTAVRCLTVRSREEPGVRSHCVFQVPPDDCVDQLLASPLASLKNAVRGVLFADEAVASGLREARVGPIPGAQRFLSLDTSDLLTCAECEADVPPNAHVSTRHPSFSFLKTVTPMREMTAAQPRDTILGRIALTRTCLFFLPNESRESASNT